MKMGGYLKDEIQTMRGEGGGGGGRKIGSFRSPEDVLSPIPGIGIRSRSGRVVLRARGIGASNEIGATSKILVLSGCLWSSRLVSGNPLPPLRMIGTMRNG